jgi:hypothetical protein
MERQQRADTDINRDRRTGLRDLQRGHELARSPGVGVVMIPFFQGAAGGAPVVSASFATTTYTGNGSTLAINNGLNLSGLGGLVWTKNRDVTSFHQLQDTIRGTNAQLNSNDPQAETTASNQIQSFGSTGYTQGSSSAVNNFGVNFVSWSFARAARFFDVVTYTGTGVTGRTVSHNLGTTPGMIIIKCRSTITGWQVGHRSIGYTKRLRLDSTAEEETGATWWNNTDPTSAVFTVGTDTDNNANGEAYVAYLFAHDTASDGIVQCGSFTTDGSGAATVTIGWRPQFAIVKRSDSTGSWFILDTARGWAGGSNNVLRANLADAEDTSSTTGGPTSTGFTIGNIGASATYVYLAIREA